MQSGDGCRSRVECRRDDAEARGRAEAEANAEQRTRREQSRGRDESRAEEAAAIAEAEPKPEAGAETEEEQRRSRAKPAEFRAMNVKMRELEFAGEERSYIGNALSARRNDCHARAKGVDRGARCTPLTPLR